LNDPGKTAVMFDFVLKWLNAVMNGLFWPLKNIPAQWSLLLISMAVGMLMLIVFKHTSNQAGIKQTKNRLKAYLLELRLYKDDVGLSLRAVRNILVSNFKYIGFAFKPMMIMAAPMLFLLLHLAARYEYRPLQVGEETIVSITARESIPLQEIVLLETEAIKIKTPPLRIPSENRVYWRIEALKEGELIFALAGKTATEKVIVGGGLKVIAAERGYRRTLKSLAYAPKLSRAGDSFISEVSVDYPKRTFSLLGVRMSWLVFFLLISLFAGLSLKGLLRVQL
jgi:hypothetical protein